jgi:hypothetical protein
MKLSLRTVGQGAVASLVGLSSFAGAVAAADGDLIPIPTGFATSFSGMVSGVLSFTMIIAALLVFFFLIWGGIDWITSAGDKGATEKARNKITAAVIGLVILAAAYAILTLSLTFLGIGSLEQALQGGKDINGNPITTDDLRGTTKK